MEKTIVLAAGCFWGTQEYFRRLHGAVRTRVGDAQGERGNPTYEPIVVETALLKQFYEAEKYHQDYLQKNPEGYCHINLSGLK